MCVYIYTYMCIYTTHIYSYAYLEHRSLDLVEHDHEAAHHHLPQAKAHIYHRISLCMDLNHR